MTMSNGDCSVVFLHLDVFVFYLLFLIFYFDTATTMKRTPSEPAVP